MDNNNQKTSIDNICCKIYQLIILFILKLILFTFIRGLILDDEWVEEIEAVKFFLKKLNYLINDSNCQIDIQRKRRGENPLDSNSTNNTIIDLDYNSEDIREELLTLKISDYIKTVIDIIRPNTPNYWIFSKNIKGKDIYIKLKICDINKIHLMSFHYAVKRIEDKPYI